jgi:hypothetical protein
MTTKMTPEQVTALLVDLQTKFPNPTDIGKYNCLMTNAECQGNYCVGGAFVQHCKQEDAPFPEGWRIVGLFQELNPTISNQDALFIADDLMTANDARDFDEAWKLIERGLTHDSSTGPYDMELPDYYAHTKASA